MFSLATADMSNENDVASWLRRSSLAGWYVEQRIVQPLDERKIAFASSCDGNRAINDRRTYSAPSGFLEVVAPMTVFIDDAELHLASCPESFIKLADMNDLDGKVAHTILSPTEEIL